MIIMKEQTLWQTLYACERVEAAFEETLKLIEDIGRRYTLCSTLKRNDEKRRRRFESEIQAAITGPPKRKHKLTPKQRRVRKQRKVKRMLKRFKKIPILRSNYVKRKAATQDEKLRDEYLERVNDKRRKDKDSANPIAYSESIQCLQASSIHEEMPPTMFMSIARRTTWLNGNNSNYDCDVVEHSDDENEDASSKTMCQSCYCCCCCTINCCCICTSNRSCTCTCTCTCTCSCSYNSTGDCRCKCDCTCTCTCECPSCYCSCDENVNDENYY